MVAIFYKYLTDFSLSDLILSSQLVTATVLAPRIISVICRLASAPAESRLADDSATSVLRVTGAFRYVNRAAVTDMTRQTAIPRLACVWTVNTTRRGKTAKSVPLVTMVMRQLVSAWKRGVLRNEVYWETRYTYLIFRSSWDRGWAHAS